MLDFTDMNALEALHTEALATGSALPDPDVLVAAATKALRNQDAQAALELIGAAFVADPQHARAWALCGTALVQLGRSEEATTAYRTAVALDEEDFVSALALAELHAGDGRIDEARGLVAWLIDQAAEAPEIYRRAISLGDSL